MSSTDRKIAFYNLEYKKHGIDEAYFDKAHFLDFIDRVESLNHQLNISKSNKAIFIEKITREQINFKEVVKVIFKSCKYNHSPDYMSSLDGRVRDSDKEMFEGEKELTHMCMHVRSEQTDIIVEERRSGTTFKEIIQFFNQSLRKYNKMHDIKNNFSLLHSIVPSENFLKSLDGMERVKVAEVYQHKKVLGSESMNLLEREDQAMKDNVMVTLNSKSGESLGKKNLKRIYRRAVGEESEITRIRVFGNDEQSNSIRLDSDYMKKLDYVKAELDKNGIVNSNSVLEKMIELLGVNLDEEAV